jgi:hypothetical protein
MARMSAALLGAFVTFDLGLLAGCQTPLPAGVAATQGAPAECPARLRDGMHLSVSAAPLSLPDGMAVQPGELLARRLLIAASPTSEAAGTRVAGSTLTITVVGGTFGGSASTADGKLLPTRTDHPVAVRSPALRAVALDRALEVIPGQLRIEPFFLSAPVRAQTFALDVTLVPGGMPAARTVASIPTLWSSAGAPLPPGAVQIAVTSEDRLTVFSVVEGQVQLNMSGVDRGGTWRCSYQTRVTLLDHDAVLPALWDLEVAAHEGQPARWLGLLAPSTGPFRAIFSDPGAARAFATWLRATSATHTGPYQLGLFEADGGTDESTVPADRDIARTFRPASSEELKGLAVRRLVEK